MVLEKVEIHVQMNEANPNCHHTKNQFKVDKAMKFNKYDYETIGRKERKNAS